MATAVKKTNWFAVWVSVAVVVVLVGVGALVVWMNNSASAPAAIPESAGIEQESGAILIGDGPDEVEVWFDFYCPHCQDFEELYGETITDLVESGDITLRAQPVALSSLNAASGTEFSARSGGAMYCVAESNPEASLEFMNQVFATSPTGEGLSDDELATIASDAGAPDAADCIAEGTYRDLALSQAQSIPENPEDGGAGTPTLLVNGEYVTVTGDVAADLTDRLG